MASCVTDPVSWNTKMLRANAVRLVPISDTSWPDHTIRKVRMCGPSPGCTGIGFGSVLAIPVLSNVAVLMWNGRNRRCR